MLFLKNVKSMKRAIFSRQAVMVMPREFWKTIILVFFYLNIVKPL